MEKMWLLVFVFLIFQNRTFFVIFDKICYKMGKVWPFWWVVNDKYGVKALVKTNKD
jgi:hypothetical protein